MELYIPKTNDRRYIMEDLIKEYEEQDNRCTAYPIYVTAQELVFVGVIKDGRDVCCPYGDGETITKYYHELFEGTYPTLKKAEEYLLEYFTDKKEAKEAIEEIEEIQCGYIWVDREWLLTIKGAEEYMKANAHNHGKMRTYVHHFERRNFEMRKLLKDIGFKVKD